MQSLTRQEIEDKLDLALKKTAHFDEYYASSGILALIKKLVRYRKKYALYVLGKVGVIHGDTQVQLCWGPKTKLPINDAQIFQMLMFGCLHADEGLLAKYFLQTLKTNDVFYDVGSSFGFYSALASELVDEGHVVAFEPSPITYQYLKNGLGGINENIVCEKIALSDKAGELNFFQMAGRSGRSTTVEDVADREEAPSIKITVPCKTLDEYIENNPIPTVIKMDIEGGELAALKGAQRLLTEYSPVIAMEVWSGELGTEHSLQAVNFLKEFDYKPFKINHDGSLSDMSSVNLDSISGMGANYIFKKMK